MGLNTVLVVCGLLAVAGPAAGQAKPAGSDPITGTWTGAMGPNESDRLSITVVLRSDGTSLTGLITGPPYPGDIKGGSFDPATGALRLDVIVRDTGLTHVVFEGRLVKDNVTGTVTFNGRTGTFEFSKSTAPASQPAKQPAGARTPEQIEAVFAARKGDFDYLLGDWEFTAQSREFGKFRGFWSAVKLDEGQILDEYRVVGDKAETHYVTTTLRNYNKFAERWELMGADAGGGVQDFGTGRRVGSEVHLEQTFGVASGNASTWRIRYFDIKPDSFSWSADRSTDGGKTWTKDFQTIEARRIGPARTMGALAPARKGG